MTTEIVSLYSPNWEPYASYGIMSMYLLHYLNEMGIHVNPYPLLNDENQGQMKFPEQSDHIHALMDVEIRPTVGGIVLGYPTMFEHYGPMLTAGPMVCVTGWESTEMPEGWVEALNHPNMKAVIVWAEWVKAMMVKAGVKAPVHVVPLGISDVYQYTQRPARDVYRFLAFGDRYTRKAWDAAVRAFAMAFGDRDDVELIIKTRKYGDRPSLVYPVGDGLMTWGGENFVYDGQEMGNVRILDEDMDEHELYELYKAVDCMVFPSRGEGFGMPTREFAATGGVSIVNEWWADDVSAWAYPIKYEMAPAWKGHRHFEGLGEWAEPDVEQLVKQMTYVLHLERNNIQYARYIGRQAARRVRKLYDWKRFAERTWEIFITPSHPTLEEKRIMRRERKRGNRRATNSI